MTEEAKIKVTTELDGKGLEQLRNALKSSIAELNAMTGSLSKNSSEFKVLKSAIADMDKTVKMSDADLKKYAQSLTTTGIEADKSEIKLGKFGKQVATTTKGLGKMAGGIVSLAGSFATLAPLVVDSDSKFAKFADTVQTVGIGVIGVGSAMGQLRYILPTLSAVSLGWIGIAGAIMNAVVALKKFTGFDIMSNQGNRENLGDISNFLEFGTTDIDKIGNELIDRVRKERRDAIDLPRGKANFEVDPTRKSMPDEFDAQRLAKIAADALKVNTGKGSKVVAEKIVKIAYDNLQEQMIALFHGGSRSAQDIFAKNVPIDSKVATVDIFTGRDVPKEVKEDSRNLLEDSQAVYSNVQNIMNALNIGTDTFVGKMLSGFGAIETIVQSLMAINSIFSFFKLPFLAEGGTAMAGMPHIVGERGAELFVPNSSGTVFSNKDTMRMLNMAKSSSPQNNVSVYINANADGVNFLKANMPRYIDKKIFKKVS